MSAQSQPSPQPRHPDLPGPRLAGRPEPPKGGLPWKTIVWFAVVGAVGVALWNYPQRPVGNQVAVNAMRVTRVSASSAAQTIRVSGTTGARNFLTVTAPLMRGPDSGRALILLDVADSGSFVKKGQKIAQIDAQSILDHVEDINASVIQADGDVRRRKAEQAIENENLQQNLRIAKANLDSAKIDAAASAIRSEIDREQLGLNVEEADAQYQAVLAAIRTTKTKHTSEIKILEITRERHARHRDRHKSDAASFTIYARISGMVVMQPIFRGGDMGQVQKGDQLTPGQPFLKIVDPASMQLEARMNQVESEGLHIGQTAELRFDAFPGLALQGRVASIGAIGVAPGREQPFNRSIPIRVMFLQRDARVIPDLSGSADIQLTASANGIVVPLESVQVENGKSFVMVRNGGQLIRKDVDVAVRTHTQAVVKTGLQAGDEVVLNR